MRIRELVGWIAVLVLLGGLATSIALYSKPSPRVCYTGVSVIWVPGPEGASISWAGEQTICARDWSFSPIVGPAEPVDPYQRPTRRE